MIDDVNDQTQKPIDEVFPGVRLPGETALQELSVDIGKRHARTLGNGTGPLC